MYKTSIVRYLRYSQIWLISGICTILGCHTRYYSSEGDPSGKHPWNMKLYTAVRDYIQNDTVAQRVFDHPGPFEVWVLEETTCSSIDWWDTGVVTWMWGQPKDQEEKRRLEDSLRHNAVVTPCNFGRNPALRQLSTTDNRLYTIVYMQIDSTFLPNDYIVSAYLSQNVCRENDLNGALWQVKMSYTLVIGKDGSVRTAISEGPIYPHMGKPCDSD